MHHMHRQLTEKEQQVVEAFAATGRVYRHLIERTILNPNSGWADIIESMTPKEIAAASGSGYTSNSFCYRHIGH